MLDGQLNKIASNMEEQQSRFFIAIPAFCLKGIEPTYKKPEY